MKTLILIIIAVNSWLTYPQCFAFFDFRPYSIEWMKKIEEDDPKVAEIRTIIFHLKKLPLKNVLPGLEGHETGTLTFVVEDNKSFFLTDWFPRYLLIYGRFNSNRDCTYVFLVTKKSESAEWQLSSCWKITTPGRMEIVFLNRPIELDWNEEVQVDLQDMPELRREDITSNEPDRDHPSVQGAFKAAGELWKQGNLPGIVSSEMGINPHSVVMPFIPEWKSQKTIPFIYIKTQRIDDESLLHYLFSKSQDSDDWQLSGSLMIKPDGYVVDLMTVPEAEPEQDDVLAIVGGRPIRSWEVMTLIEYSKASSLSSDFLGISNAREMSDKELYAAAIDFLMDREMALWYFELGLEPDSWQQAAESTKAFIQEVVAIRESYKDILSNADISEAQFYRFVRKNVTFLKFVLSLAEELPKPNETQLKEHYESNLERFKMDSAIQLRSIGIPKTEAGSEAKEGQLKLAQEIQERLINGSKVSDLEKEFEIENFQGDDPLAWLEHQALRQDLADIAFGLKEGGVSDIIDEQDRYLLFRVEKKRAPSVADFEEVRSQVAKHYNDHVQSKKAFKKFLEGVQEQIVIIRLDKD